jgi:cytochrome aa3-600 menaquinol oxidase subunit II
MSSNQPSRLKRMLWIVAPVMLLLSGCDSKQFVVLHPAGPVAKSEFQLMWITVLPMLVVIAFVFGMFAFVLVKYRDKPGNKAPYMPNWKGSNLLETIWTIIPIIIVTIIGVPTVMKTFSLNATPPGKDPITIKVQSLDWKWLFEYPDGKVATVNYVNIPTGVPVQFELTSNAPMNTFWVPELGGMEYTMPGMTLGLWLQADKSGTYTGRSGNFSGEGFVHMTFNVNAVPQDRYDSWLQKTEATAKPMTEVDYKNLVKPSVVNELTYSSWPLDTWPKDNIGMGNMKVENAMPMK